MNDTRVRVEGCDVRVLRSGGEGPEAVVYIHGNPGSADDWRGLLAATGPGLPSLAFDLPDFGITTAPPGFVHDVPSYAGFAAKLLTALGVERFHLVVHDFGGPIGLVLAASGLDRLAGITLIDTGILPGYEWHRMARIWRTPVLGELVQALTTRAIFRTVLARQEPRQLPRAFLDRMYDQYDRRTRRAVLRLYRATDEPGSAAPMLTQLFAAREIPALVVWGGQDAYLPPTFAPRQRDAFPSASLQVMPGSGHWPFIDAAEDVERIVVEDLQQRIGPRR